MTEAREDTNVVDLGRIRHQRRERFAQTAEPLSLANAALSILSDNRAAQIAEIAMRLTMKPGRCHRQTRKAIDGLIIAATPQARRKIAPIRQGQDPKDAQKALVWMAAICKACQRCPLGQDAAPRSAT